jgi:5-methylcytosine-specific restriction endonuclease McrA
VTGSRNWPNGSPAGWRKVRKQVLERDGYQCQIGLQGCTVHATHVHHTIGRDVTGDNPAFLVAACEHCNKKTGDPRRISRGSGRVSRDPDWQPHKKWW